MLEVCGQVNYDKSRLLDFRALLGGGLRVRLVRADVADLAVGTGLVFEHESLGLPPEAGHPRATAVHRSSSYVSLRVTPAPGLVASSTGYAQPKIVDFADLRILNESGIAVAVTGQVTLRAQFELRYDSRPPDGVVRLGTKLTNGIAIRF